MAKCRPPKAKTFAQTYYCSPGLSTTSALTRAKKHLEGLRKKRRRKRK